MSTYTLKITKGKYELNLTTSDRDMISEQFETWVRQASEYARQKKAKEHKDIAENKIIAEEIITQKNIDAQIAKHSERKTSDKEEKIDDKLEKSVSEENVEKPVIEDVQKDLDIFYSPQKPAEENNAAPEAETKQASGGIFDNLLEKAMDEPKTELSFRPSPSIKKDNAYINYMSSRSIEKKMDYLLLTAYYFAQYEQIARFTLKQLNAKLMQNLAVIIDHSVLQEAINRGYIECLPDLTGVVGASEYRLTAYGEKNLLEE